MKSAFMRMTFRDGSKESLDAFLRDLKFALSLNENQQKEVLADLPAIRLASTNHQSRQILTRLASKVGLPPTEVEDAVKPLSFLMAQLADTDAPPDDFIHWGDDLLEASAIDEGQKHTFDALIKSLKSTAEDVVQPEAKRRSVIQRMAPTLKGVDTAVGVVAVNRSDYMLGMSLENYDPVIDDVAPMVALKLKLNDAPFEELTLHLEETDLQILFDSLAAAKKDMQAFKRYLKTAS